jgi:hypothetical protein
MVVDQSKIIQRHDALRCKSGAKKAADCLIYLPVPLYRLKYDSLFGESNAFNEDASGNNRHSWVGGNAKGGRALRQGYARRVFCN